MENQKSMTLQTSEHVVAYGYNQRFYLTAAQAQALVAATEDGKKIVKFKDKVLSTNYSWIAPIEQVEKVDLNSKELAVAEQIAEWISRPVNNSDMSYLEALNYSKKLVKTQGIDKTNDLLILKKTLVYAYILLF